MNRIILLLACGGALLLAACGSDSKLPRPTGDGAVRAVNAISGSPDVNFLIEERLIAPVGYKQSTGPEVYNDFEYNFNFEILYPGEPDPTRVATYPFKVEKDREHVFVLTGDVTAPDIVVWSSDIREWGGEETVFEARFSHAAASLTDVDVYFDQAGTVLGTNPPVATLSPGEISGAFDYEEGDYVMTVTDAGAIGEIRYVSSNVSITAQFAHLFTVFDGDGNDPAPITVRSRPQTGNTLVMPDSRFEPTVRFIHGAFTLETVDIYDDEALTSLVAEDLAFQGATADVDASTDAIAYYFTPANSQATVLFEIAVPGQTAGTVNHIFLNGDTGTWAGRRVLPDRSSTAVAGKLRVFSASLAYPIADIYVTDRGEPILEEDIPLFFATYPEYSAIVQFAAGNYDIHFTDRGTQDLVAQEPYQLDLAAGDVVELMLVDTADPNVIEVVNVPLP